MIHPTAVIDPAAELDSQVEIGPFAVIGPEVTIGAGTSIGPHAVVRGPTRIGRDNRIFQFASVGEDPQDKKYGGEPTWLEIGDRNRIRECCTLHRGTAQDRGVTRIGDDNLFMAYTHVAHDCQIGNQVIMANGATLGGHVQIDDWAILGGFTLIHQFCRVGTHSFCAMGAALSQDVPPYVLVGGQPCQPHGINAEGLRRRGFSKATIAALRRAYRVLYLSGRRLEQALEELRALAVATPQIQPLVDFIAVPGRGIVR